MANTDKGYTQISNRVLDELIQLRLSGTHVSVVLYVLRKTLGWNKPSDRISVSLMAKTLRITRRWCSGVVGDLEKMGILFVAETKSGAIRTMQIRDPENWDKPENYYSHENKTSHGNKTSHPPEKKSSQGWEEKFSGGGNKTSQEPEKKSSHTKYNINTLTKNTITKDRETSPTEDDDDFEGYTGEELLRMWREEQARERENGTV